MKVEWRREPRSRAVLEIEIPADQVAREIRDAAARLARKVRVPGFRPGKTPRMVLERYIGRDELYGEAMEALVESGYRRAVADAGVLPVGRPEFDLPPLDEAGPLRFVARVDILPQVDPGGYDKVRVPSHPPEITEAHVDAALEEMRRRRSRLASAPEARAAIGDFVLIRPAKVEGTDRFQADREVLVELGGGVYPPEVERALEGAAAGDARTVTLADGGRLEALVVDVRRRELPPFDDAFARSLGDASSLDELRARLRERLVADAAAEAQEAYEEQVLGAVLQGATVDLPVTMVEQETDYLVADVEASLQRRGYTLERYLAQAGKDLEGLRQELRARAERRLSARLVLDEIASREGLVPTQEEIAAEEEKVAADLKQDAARVREWLEAEGRWGSMVAMLRRRKTVATLVARAREG